MEKLKILLYCIRYGCDIAAEKKCNGDRLVADESVELAEEITEVVEIVIVSDLADSVDVDMCKVIVLGADAADECQYLVKTLNRVFFHINKTDIGLQELVEAVATLDAYDVAVGSGYFVDVIDEFSRFACSLGSCNNFNHSFFSFGDCISIGIIRMELFYFNCQIK